MANAPTDLDNAWADVTAVVGQPDPAQYHAAVADARARLGRPTSPVRRKPGLAPVIDLAAARQRRR